MLNQGIFPRKTEIFNLVFPLIFVILAVFEISFSRRPQEDDRYLIFIANTFFLNAGHAAFSFFFAFYLPEGRALLKYDNYKEAKRLFLVSSFVVLFFSTFFFQFQPNYFSVPLIILMFFLVSALPGFWHILFQIRGIGLMYGQSVDGSKLGVKKNKVWDFALKGEYLFLLIFFFWADTFFYYLLDVFDLSKLISSRRLMHYYTSFFGFVIVILILWNQLSKDKIHWNRLIFHMRLFNLVLSPLSSFALFGMKATHGLESLFFAQSVSRKTQMQGKGNFFYLVFWGCLLFFTIYCIPRFYLGANTDIILSKFRSVNYPSFDSPWILVYIVIGSSITTLHYYLDSRLFKMRNQSVRDTTGIFVSTSGSKSQ